MITNKDLEKLNEFHRTQPALTHVGERKDNANVGVRLGDLIREGHSSASVIGTWDFDVDGGAVDVYSLGVKLPKGALVKGVYTNTVSAVTSAGTPEIDVLAGATVLASIADATALSGVESQTVTLVKLSDEEYLNFEIKTAAATAGKVEVIVEYLAP